MKSVQYYGKRPILRRIEALEKRAKELLDIEDISIANVKYYGTPPIYKRI